MKNKQGLQESYIRGIFELSLKKKLEFQQSEIGDRGKKAGEGRLNEMIYRMVFITFQQNKANVKY